MKEHIKAILTKIEENPEREGLIETPSRVEKFYKEFLNPDKFELTVFEKESYDQMIVECDIPFYSLCEHHMVPFMGVAHIGYIPDKHIVGLSKLPRVLDMFARRLQNQERITQQVVDYLQDKLNAKGVACVIEAEHLCMAMRGIKKPGVKTVTSAMTKEFMTDINTRQEFLSHIGRNKR